MQAVLPLGEGTTCYMSCDCTELSLGLGLEPAAHECKVTGACGRMQNIAALMLLGRQGAAPSGTHFTLRYHRTGHPLLPLRRENAACHPHRAVPWAGSCTAACMNTGTSWHSVPPSPWPRWLEQGRSSGIRIPVRGSQRVRPVTAAAAGRALDSTGTGSSGQPRSTQHFGMVLVRSLGRDRKSVV